MAYKRDLPACPYCGNTKGNTSQYDDTLTTKYNIIYYRKCGNKKDCGRRFRTYHTTLDPDRILDEITKKVTDLRNEYLRRL